MKKHILLATVASLGIALPVALAQRFIEAPAVARPIGTGGSLQNNLVQNNLVQNTPLHHCGMMQEMQVNSEFEYLTKMIPHHQEAVETARLVLAGSNRPEMQRFAENIIEVQTAEIEQMQQWLQDWYPGQNTTVAYTPMMRDLDNLQGDALDQAFLEDMIMHHMGAVMMSRMLLNRDLVQHQLVTPFAEQIAASQRQEIWQMQSWLQDWFDEGAMPGMMHGGRMMHGFS